MRRLALEDDAALEARLDPVARALWAATQPVDRPYLRLALSLHSGLPGVAERTGLSPAMPRRGFTSWPGGPPPPAAPSTDLVSEALAAAAAPLSPGSRVLDFGCSSGRVVRALAAAHPDAEWHGCDPIGPAIDWARQNLAGVAFVHSPPEPPLPYEPGAFDAAYAISIWSHFGAAAGSRWLEEMRRVIRPGGHLVVTTQGWSTLRHLATYGLWSPADLCRVAEEMHAAGFSYRDVFGGAGDFGVKGPEWGMAFLTLEWLLARTTPGWALGWYREGRNEANQDVLVLARRPDPSRDGRLLVVGRCYVGCTMRIWLPDGSRKAASTP